MYRALWYLNGLPLDSILCDRQAQRQEGQSTGVRCSLKYIVLLMHRAPTEIDTVLTIVNRHELIDYFWRRCARPDRLVRKVETTDRAKLHRQRIHNR